MSPADVLRVRQALGLSQAEVAGLLGVHPLTVLRWERGQLTPGPWQVAMLNVFANAVKRIPRVGRRVKESGRDGLPHALFVLLAAGLPYAACAACAARGCPTCEGYGYLPRAALTPASEAAGPLPGGSAALGRIPGRKQG